MEEPIKSVDADKRLLNLSDLNLKLKEYKKILFALQRDKEMRDEERQRLSKITQQRKRNRKTEENKCFTCKSLADKDPSESLSTCSGCSQKKEKCSNGNQRSGYECKKCEEDRIVHQKAGEWLLEQLKLRLRTPNDGAHHQNNETPQSISRIQRDKVREFVEELLSSMLNGPLDDVCVGQLYKSEKYIPLWNHECPGVAHVELKRLIQKIVDEILSLPESLNLGGNHSPGRQQEEALPYFDPKKYEELLATAVINKAINIFKNEKNVTENSSGIHTDSELDSNHNTRKELLNHQLARNAANNYFYSGGSTPTSQPMSSEFSLEKHDTNVLYSSHNSQDYLNDYIQNHRVPLPEISSESNNEDDLQSVTSAGTDGTWEENWLFKKRKLKTDASVSIAMLVPSPTEDIKALIGDQNVDEVSDLSETESKNGDEEQLNSINGYNSLPAFSDNRLQPDSLISNHSLPEYEPLVTEAKNDLIFVGSRLTDPEPASADHTMEGSETSSLTTNSGGDNKYSEENNNIIETIELNMAETKTQQVTETPTISLVETTVTQGDTDEANNNNNLVELNNVKNSVITTAELILAPPEEFQPIPAERTIIAQTEASEMASHTAIHNVETEKIDTGSEHEAIDNKIEVNIDSQENQSAVVNVVSTIDVVQATESEPAHNLPITTMMEDFIGVDPEVGLPTKLSIVIDTAVEAKNFLDPSPSEPMKRLSLCSIENAEEADEARKLKLVESDEWPEDQQTFDRPTRLAARRSSFATKDFSEDQFYSIDNTNVEVDSVALSASLVETSAEKAAGQGKVIENQLIREEASFVQTSAIGIEFKTDDQTTDLPATDVSLERAIEITNAEVLYSTAQGMLSEQELNLVNRTKDDTAEIISINRKPSLRRSETIDTDSQSKLYDTTDDEDPSTDSSGNIASEQEMVSETERTEHSIKCASENVNDVDLLVRKTRKLSFAGKLDSFTQTIDSDFVVAEMTNKDEESAGVSTNPQETVESEYSANIEIQVSENVLTPVPEKSSNTSNKEIVPVVLGTPKETVETSTVETTLAAVPENISTKISTDILTPVQEKSEDIATTKTSSDNNEPSVKDSANIVLPKQEKAAETSTVEIGIAVTETSASEISIDIVTPAETSVTKTLTEKIEPSVTIAVIESSEPEKTTETSKLEIIAGISKTLSTDIVAPVPEKTIETEIRETPESETSTVAPVTVTSASKISSEEAAETSTVKIETAVPETPSTKTTTNIVTPVPEKTGESSATESSTEKSITVSPTTEVSTPAPKKSVETSTVDIVTAVTETLPCKMYTEIDTPDTTIAEETEVTVTPMNEISADVVTPVSENVTDISSLKILTQQAVEDTPATNISSEICISAPEQFTENPVIDTSKEKFEKLVTLTPTAGVSTESVAVEFETPVTETPSAIPSAINTSTDIVKTVSDSLVIETEQPTSGKQASENSVEILKIEPENATVNPVTETPVAIATSAEIISPPPEYATETRVVESETTNKPATDIAVEILKIESDIATESTGRETPIVAIATPTGIIAPPPEYAAETPVTKSPTVTNNASTDIVKTVSDSFAVETEQPIAETQAAKNSAEILKKESIIDTDYIKNPTVTMAIPAEIVSPPPEFTADTPGTETLTVEIVELSTENVSPVSETPLTESLTGEIVTPGPEIPASEIFETITETSAAEKVIPDTESPSAEARVENVTSITEKPTENLVVENSTPVKDVAVPDVPAKVSFDIVTPATKSGTIETSLTAASIAETAGTDISITDIPVSETTIKETTIAESVNSITVTNATSEVCTETVTSKTIEEIPATETENITLDTVTLAIAKVKELPVEISVNETPSADSVTPVPEIETPVSESAMETLNENPVMSVTAEITKEIVSPLSETSSEETGSLAVPEIETPLVEISTKNSVAETLNDDITKTPEVEMSSEIIIPTPETLTTKNSILEISPPVKETSTAEDNADNEKVTNISGKQTPETEILTVENSTPVADVTSTLVEVLVSLVPETPMSENSAVEISALDTDTMVAEDIVAILTPTENKTPEIATLVTETSPTEIIVPVAENSSAVKFNSEISSETVTHVSDTALASSETHILSAELKTEGVETTSAEIYTRIDTAEIRQTEGISMTEDPEAETSTTITENLAEQTYAAEISKTPVTDTVTVDIVTPITETLAAEKTTDTLAPEGSIETHKTQTTEPETVKEISTEEIVTADEIAPKKIAADISKEIVVSVPEKAAEKTFIEIAIPVTEKLASLKPVENSATIITETDSLTKEMTPVTETLTEKQSSEIVAPAKDGVTDTLVSANSTKMFSLTPEKALEHSIQEISAATSTEISIKVLSETAEKNHTTENLPVDSLAANIAAENVTQIPENITKTPQAEINTSIPETTVLTEISNLVTEILATEKPVIETLTQETSKTEKPITEIEIPVEENLAPTTPADSSAKVDTVAPETPVTDTSTEEIVTPVTETSTAKQTLEIIASAENRVAESSVVENSSTNSVKDISAEIATYTEISTKMEATLQGKDEEIHATETMPVDTLAAEISAENVTQLTEIVLAETSTPVTDILTTEKQVTETLKQETSETKTSIKKIETPVKENLAPITPAENSAIIVTMVPETPVTDILGEEIVTSDTETLATEPEIVTPAKDEVTKTPKIETLVTEISVIETTTSTVETLATEIMIETTKPSEEKTIETENSVKESLETSIVEILNPVPDNSAAIIPEIVTPPPVTPETLISETEIATLTIVKKTENPGKDTPESEIPVTETSEISETSTTETVTLEQEKATESSIKDTPDSEITATENSEIDQRGTETSAGVTSITEISTKTVAQGQETIIIKSETDILPVEVLKSSKETTVAEISTQLAIPEPEKAAETLETSTLVTEIETPVTETAITATTEISAEIDVDVPAVTEKPTAVIEIFTSIQEKIREIPETEISGTNNPATESSTLKIVTQPSVVSPTPDKNIENKVPDTSANATPPASESSTEFVQLETPAVLGIEKPTEISTEVIPPSTIDIETSITETTEVVTSIIEKSTAISVSDIIVTSVTDMSTEITPATAISSEAIPNVQEPDLDSSSAETLLDKIMTPVTETSDAETYKEIITPPTEKASEALTEETMKPIEEMTVADTPAPEKPSETPAIEICAEIVTPVSENVTETPFVETPAAMSVVTKTLAEYSIPEESSEISTTKTVNEVILPEEDTPVAEKSTRIAPQSSEKVSELSVQEISASIAISTEISLKMDTPLPEKAAEILALENATETPPAEIVTSIPETTEETILSEILTVEIPTQVTATPAEIPSAAQNSTDILTSVPENATTTQVIETVVTDVSVIETPAEMSSTSEISKEVVTLQQETPLTKTSTAEMSTLVTETQLRITLASEICTSVPEKAPENPVVESPAEKIIMPVTETPAKESVVQETAAESPVAQTSNTEIATTLTTASEVTPAAEIPIIPTDGVIKPPIFETRAEMQPAAEIEPLLESSSSETLPTKESVAVVAVDITNTPELAENETQAIKLETVVPKIIIKFEEVEGGKETIFELQEEDLDEDVIDRTINTIYKRLSTTEPNVIENFVKEHLYSTLTFNSNNKVEPFPNDVNKVSSASTHLTTSNQSCKVHTAEHTNWHQIDNKKVRIKITDHNLDKNSTRAFGSSVIKENDSSKRIKEIILTDPDNNIFDLSIETLDMVAIDRAIDSIYRRLTITEPSIIEKFMKEQLYSTLASNTICSVKEKASTSHEPAINRTIVDAPANDGQEMTSEISVTKAVEQESLVEVEADIKQDVASSAETLNEQTILVEESFTAEPTIQIETSAAQPEIEAPKTNKIEDSVISTMPVEPTDEHGIAISVKDPSDSFIEPADENKTSDVLSDTVEPAISDITTEIVNSEAVTFATEPEVKTEISTKLTSLETKTTEETVSEFAVEETVSETNTPSVEEAVLETNTPAIEQVKDISNPAISDISAEVIITEMIPSVAEPEVTTEIAAPKTSTESSGTKTLEEPTVSQISVELAVLEAVTPNKEPEVELKVASSESKSNVKLTSIEELANLNITSEPVVQVETSEPATSDISTELLISESICSATMNAELESIESKNFKESIISEILGEPKVSELNTPASEPENEQNVQSNSTTSDISGELDVRTKISDTVEHSSAKIVLSELEAESEIAVLETSEKITSPIAKQDTVQEIVAEISCGEAKTCESTVVSEISVDPDNVTPQNVEIMQSLDSKLIDEPIISEILTEPEVLKTSNTAVEMEVKGEVASPAIFIIEEKNSVKELTDSNIYTESAVAIETQPASAESVSLEFTGKIDLTVEIEDAVLEKETPAVKPLGEINNSNMPAEPIIEAEPPISDISAEIVISEVIPSIINAEVIQEIVATQSLATETAEKTIASELHVEPNEIETSINDVKLEENPSIAAPTEQSTTKPVNVEPLTFEISGETIVSEDITSAIETDIVASEVYGEMTSLKNKRPSVEATIILETETDATAVGPEIIQEQPVLPPTALETMNAAADLKNETKVSENAVEITPAEKSETGALGIEPKIIQEATTLTDIPSVQTDLMEKSVALESPVESPALEMEVLTTAIRAPEVAELLSVVEVVEMPAIPEILPEKSDVSCIKSEILESVQPVFVESETSDVFAETVTPLTTRELQTSEIKTPETAEAKTLETAESKQEDTSLGTPEKATVLEIEAKITAPEASEKVSTLGDGYVPVIPEIPAETQIIKSKKPAAAPDAFHETQIVTANISSLSSENLQSEIASNEAEIITEQASNIEAHTLTEMAVTSTIIASNDQIEPVSVTATETSTTTFISKTEINLNTTSKRSRSLGSPSTSRKNSLTFSNRVPHLVDGNENVAVKPAPRKSVSGAHKSAYESHRKSLVSEINPTVAIPQYVRTECIYPFWQGSRKSISQRVDEFIHGKAQEDQPALPDTPPTPPSDVKKEPISPPADCKAVEPDVMTAEEEEMLRHQFLRLERRLSSVRTSTSQAVKSRTSSDDNLSVAEPGRRQSDTLRHYVSEAIQAEVDLILDKAEQKAIEFISESMLSQHISPRSSFSLSPRKSKEASPVRSPRQSISSLSSGLTENIKNPQSIQATEPASTIKPSTQSQTAPPTTSSPTHARYQSPLFQSLLPKTPGPQPIKMSVSIPDDGSLDSLLHIAHIISGPTAQTTNTTNNESTNNDNAKLECQNSNSNPSQISDNHNDANNNESDLGYSQTSHPPASDDIINANQPATAEDEDVVHLIPGSIAEREHLKWQNAEPMANNPYSSEALQRRLICGNTKPMDIHLVLEDNTQASDSNVEDKENKTLQSAFEEDLTDYTRYGRDYYINDAKKASGTRKSMNDLKTFMDSDMISDTDAANNVEVEQPAPAQKPQSEPPITATILPRSKTNNGVTYLARPVQINDDTTTASPDETNPQSMSPRPGSLTISEDSDTTRIYDLNTGETKLVQDTKRQCSLEALSPQPQAMPVGEQQDSLDSPIHAQVRKAVSEETLKFFSPKRPPKYATNQKKFEEHHENIVRAFRRHSLDRATNEITDKLVIEKEVIEALPSVKDLAKIYIHNDEQEAPLPKAKPKTFIVKENENDTHIEPKRTDVGKINLKAVAKNYDSGPVHKFKAGHSITARSISRSLREELKNTPTEPTITESDKVEKPEKRHTSPERPPSPVLMPGNLKNSIAFFENLK